MKNLKTSLIIVVLLFTTINYMTARPPYTYKISELMGQGETGQPDQVQRDLANILDEYGLKECPPEMKYKSFKQYYHNGQELDSLVNIWKRSESTRQIKELNEARLKGGQ